MDWEQLSHMGSSRLFLLRKGDAAFIPAGTYHYVFTVRTKIAIAVDFMSAVGWKRRIASVERDRQLVPPIKEEIGALPKLFEHGVLYVELPRVQDAARHGVPLSEARRAELVEVLQWAVHLEREVPAQRPLRAALRELWDHVHGLSEVGDECPWA